MSGMLKAVVAAMAVLAAPGAAAAQVWTEWTEAEGRALMAAENGVVTEVEIVDGELRLYGIIDDWFHVGLYGSDCSGVGAKLTCTALGLNALFEVDDAARSQALQAEMDFRYVADVADGQDLIIHRQVELEGGASLPNIRAQVNGFVVVGELVRDTIWPPKGDADPAKAD